MPHSMDMNTSLNPVATNTTAPNHPPLSHSLAEHPILFAHRGGRDLGPDNSLPTFQMSLATGVGGLESDLRLTADGIAVLAHDAALWHHGCRRKIARRPLAQLPARLTRLTQFYKKLGSDFELSLDVKPASHNDSDYATRSAQAALNCAGETEQWLGQPAVSRLWLCHPNWELLANWRKRWPQVKLVNSTTTKQLKTGLERRTAQLADAGIDALNLPQQNWNKELVEVTHRSGVLAFGWDAHFEPVIAKLLSYNIDAIYGDNPNKLLATRHTAIQTDLIEPSFPTTPNHPL